MTATRLTLAISLLAASTPVLCDEQAPRNPVSAIRNAWTECGAGARQETCDTFFTEYRAYERTVSSGSPQAIAERRAEYEAMRARSAVATLPVVDDASKLAFNASMQQDIAKIRPRAPGLTREIRLRFHLDPAGKPYHSSANADRLNVNQRDFRMYATPNDRIRVCTPIDEPQRWVNLTNIAQQGCVALQGVTFQPARDASGKAVAATVDATLVVSADSIRLVPTKATTLMFPRTNEPTRAWSAYNEQRRLLER